MPRITSRRALLKMTAGLSVAALLAACVNKTSVPGIRPTQPANPTQTLQANTVQPATPTPKPSATPELRGDILVTVASGSYKGWQVTAEAYRKLHPRVQVVIDLKRGTPSERDAYYRAQLASGTPAMSLATVNTLDDLFGQQAFLNWKPYLERVNPYTGAIWSESFLEESLVFGQESPERQYMLSTELFQIVFFVNLDLAKTLGLNPDAPPATFSELAAWASAARDLYVGFDIWETSDQLDWLARIYADTWYSTPAYWQLCACQPGDPCHDPSKPSFPASDWRTNRHYDDPDKVSFNYSRAWDAFDAGYFLGGQDTRFELMTSLFKTVFSADSLPQDWRTSARTAPLLFLTNQALMYPAGSNFVAGFVRGKQQMRSGILGNWPQGKQAPTPDPVLTRARSFTLGAFPCPLQEHAQILVQFQRTVEQPVGYWGIPRKIAQQNELEVDFVMFATSPAAVRSRMLAELDEENAEGNINGLSTVKGVSLGEPWDLVFARLAPQGNINKPHPLNMIYGGLPSSANRRKALMADFLESADADPSEYKAQLRALREQGREDERAIEPI